MDIVADEPASVLSSAPGADMYTTSVSPGLRLNGPVAKSIERVPLLITIDVRSLVPPLVS